MTLENETLRAPAGTILLQQKNDAYQLRATSADDTDYIVISYLAEPMEALLSLLPGRTFASPRIQKYHDLFEQVMRITHFPAVCMQARLCAAVQEILCCIIQEHHRKSGSQPEGYAEKALLFMEKNFPLPLTSDLIASEVGISPSHLRTVFRERYDTSPMQKVNEIRIEHAKKMIRSGSFTLHEVAEACGFQNEYYFSRVFKKFTGISPGKY